MKARIIIDIEDQAELQGFLTSLAAEVVVEGEDTTDYPNATEDDDEVPF